MKSTNPGLLSLQEELNRTSVISKDFKKTIMALAIQAVAHGYDKGQKDATVTPFDDEPADLPEPVPAGSYGKHLFDTTVSVKAKVPANSAADALTLLCNRIRSGIGPEPAIGTRRDWDTTLTDAHAVRL